MGKPKLGEVRYVESVGGNYVPVTVTSREVHNNREFYRVKESTTGLFLAQSLLNAPPNEPVNCELCGGPLPAGEEMFNYHGYSGPCPKPPKPQPASWEQRFSVLSGAIRDLLFVVEIPESWGPKQTKAFRDAERSVQAALPEDIGKVLEK